MGAVARGRRCCSCGGPGSYFRFRGPAPGGRPGRRAWSWSKAEVEGFGPSAQNLAGRGSGARLSRGAGSGARSAPRRALPLWGSGASPSAPLLSIPPTEPSSAAEGEGRTRGGGAGGGQGEPGDRGSGGTELLHRALLSSLVGDSAEGGGSKGRCGAPRPPWAQAPPLSTARGVAGGQGRGRGAEWRPAHPAPHSRAEGSDKGEGAFQAPAQVSTSYSRGCGMGEGSWPASPGVTP